MQCGVIVENIDIVLSAALFITFFPIILSDFSDYLT